MPLKNFVKSFKIDQEKEILPYSMYNACNLKTKFIKVETCKKYCDHQVKCDNLARVVTKQDEEEYFKCFMNNCCKWNCIKDGLVDIIEYSARYCEIDVEVLQKGYLKFGEMLKESCKLDIKDYMSAAQLAHQYMLKNEVFEGVNQLSSTPREYIIDHEMCGWWKNYVRWQQNAARKRCCS